jgi:hypothetical protein
MTLMIAAGVWFAVAAVAARAVGTMLREANERTTRPASP